MNNTIFDDVFRTMIEKMPYLAVPLINEVFHTSYPEDVKITQLRNEHQQEDGEIITDSCLLIGKKMYHIECQSTDDTTMVIRMIEYDFAIGIEHAEKKGHDFNNNPELFQTLLNEYEEIRVNLEKELTETGKSELYTDLTKLIVKIADYIFREEDEVRKGLGDIMGGKVLELESERLKAEEQAVECASERAKAIWEDFLILTTVRFRQRLIQKFMWIKQNFWTIRIE